MSVEEFRRMVSLAFSKTKPVEPKKISAQSKYRSRKYEVGDRTFDSEKEAKRYADLITLQKAGIIKNLELQKTYELIPTQRDESGKVIERACYYYADFVYERCDGVKIVEDVKSKATKTPLYVVKSKLMLYRYGVKVQEVEE